MWYYGSRNEASFKFQHLTSVLGFCIILHDALSVSVAIPRKNISEACLTLNLIQWRLHFRFEIRPSRYRKLHCVHFSLIFACAYFMKWLMTSQAGRTWTLPRAQCRVNVKTFSAMIECGQFGFDRRAVHIYGPNWDWNSRSCTNPRLRAKNSRRSLFETVSYIESIEGSRVNLFTKTLSLINSCNWLHELTVIHILDPNSHQHHDGLGIMSPIPYPRPPLSWRRPALSCMVPTPRQSVECPEYSEIGHNGLQIHRFLEPR